MVALPCRGEPADCDTGACAPHCPVRPGQFGYYATQWRRWPEAGPAPARSRDAVPPAPPPRSIVPGADEESPDRVETPPRDAADGRPRRPDAAIARLERLTAEAEAVRVADAAGQHEFTLRLVTAMLSEHDPQARRAVLALAATFETPAAAAICTGALDDPDPRVRFEACQACVHRGGPGGIERLARRARDDVDLGVRLRAVRALGELGESAAIPHLVALLDDPDPAVRNRAGTALARTTGLGYGSDVERWRIWAADPRAAARRSSSGVDLRQAF